MGILDERGAFAGKTAIVVGGAGGLGRGITVDLDQAGVEVAVCDIDPTRLDVLGELLGRPENHPLLHCCDATDPSALTEFFRICRNQLPHVDILVNVAGASRLQDFAETVPDDWDWVIGQNFRYAVHSCWLALDLIRATRRGGSIINVTTIEAHRAAPRFAVYSGAKAALWNFSRSLAVELAAEGIRVNTVAPDYTPTERMRAMRVPGAGSGSESAEELRDRAIAMYIPMGRPGVLDDVSNCVLFLASDLSTYVTGSTLHPDGGTSASLGWVNWPETGYLPMPPSSVAALWSVGAPPVGPPDA